MAKKKVGRSRFEDEAMERVNVSLNDTRRYAIKKIGGGNISKGIRILADVYKESPIVRACVREHKKDNKSV